MIRNKSDTRIGVIMSLITIGIDVGGSTTKIVGLLNGEILSPFIVRATDPLASLFGAFGKFIDRNNLRLEDISSIMVTGVGSSFLDKPIYGIPTVRKDEFLCNGLGGLYLSGLQKAIIVSMGTGTSIVKAEGETIIHLGGTGIGGGTILGLSNKMLNIRDIKLLIAMAEGGDLKNIDLMVGDITKDVFPTLPAETTASNFGRISDVASKADIALGIFNLVFQSIGMTAVFASRNSGINDIVLIGNLTVIPQGKELFEHMKKVSSVNFIFPENSEFATAVGAALCAEQRER